MTRAASWYLNGVSLATLGFQPEPTEPGRRSGLSQSVQGIEIPGVAGELDMGAPVRAPARYVTVAGEVRGANRDAVLEAIRTILAHAGRGAVALRCVDAADRVILVDRVDATAGVFAPSMLAAQRDGRVALRFRAAEPAWRDLVPQVLVIGQTPVPCPLGYQLGSPWTLDILGSEAGVVTDPELHYEDAAGNAVASLELTGTLNWSTDATARYRVSTDGLAPRVRKMVAGVWEDADDEVSAGGFFQLSPLDGWPAGEDLPTLRVFDAAARARAVLRYTRRHEA